MASCDMVPRCGAEIGYDGGMKPTIYDGWREILAERFPKYDSRQRDTEWAQVKQKLTIGQSIIGAVMARAPFGAWIELGIDFPALLAITVIADLTPERYRAGEWCPIGTEVTAFIVAFDDRNHQVRLSQVRQSRDDSN